MQKEEEIITYPKLSILIATYIIAYLIFSDGLNSELHNLLIPLGYLGIFIAGILYTYGFTSAIATAVLLIIAGDQNIFLAAIIGGIGATIGDLTILKFIRHSVDDEFKNLTKEKAVNYVTSRIPEGLKKHLVVILGYVILSSPLPDEIGVSLLASYTKISEKMFMLVSYVMNTLGILIVLAIGNAL